MVVKREYAPDDVKEMPSNYGFLYPKLVMKDTDRKTIVEQVLNPLIFNYDTVTRVKKVFIEEMELGLSANPAKKSSLQMENTFLPDLPNGTEEGEFLALDLGGTNFRVIHLRVTKGDINPEYNIEYYSVPEKTRLGPGVDLFDFLASCIKDFLDKNKLTDRQLDLGFCFSFPMIQKGLNTGILVSWTKSFNCSGVVGKDAVQMLNDAMARKQVKNVRVVAVVNDTTGTLAKGAFVDRNCFIGLILGTGCNGCYLEKCENIPKFVGQDRELVNEVVIDTEFGAFGDNGVLNFVKTEFDIAVDNNSLLIGNFTFEKLFAGKFLGELVRNILTKLIQLGVLFNGIASPEMREPQMFEAAHVSIFESLEDNPDEERAVLEKFGYSDVSDDDLNIVRQVCGVASTRGAILVSICIATLLQRMSKPFCTVAIDGSLFKHHPQFAKMMVEIIRFLAPGHQFKLILAKDGSGKGAGIVAAVAARLIREGKVILH